MTTTLAWFKHARKHFGRASLSCGVLALWAFLNPAFADYPQRPVRIVVGVAPGGSSDTYARMIARQLGDRLGQPVIVENKPGANTRIAMETLSHAAADGHTLAIAYAVSANFPSLFPDFPFVPGKNFTPVSMLGKVVSYVAVRKDLPPGNATEFDAYVRSSNGKMAFGHGAEGSNTHLAALAMLKSMSATATAVVYKGTVPIGPALASGEIDFSVIDYAAVRPMVERGAVRLLASTTAKRSPLTPDVPTVAEAGMLKDMTDMVPWFMLIAPAGTPEPIVRLLNRHVNEIVHDADNTKTLLNLGIEPKGGTAAEAGQYFLQQRQQIEQRSREFGVSAKN